jgi:hypothetical protein
MFIEGLVDAETSGAQPDSSPQIYAMSNLSFSLADVAEHHVPHGNPIESLRLGSLKFSNWLKCPGRGFTAHVEYG